jgi:DNA mismatch repair protein MutL
VQAQSLLMPETVELQPRDAETVRNNSDLLRKMGFGISEFGGDAFVVDALPAYFAHASPQSLLLDIAHELEETGGRGSKGRWREDSIAQAACKAAVKARDHLTLDEIERLVVDLSRAGMPYTCPHGRPTLIYTSFTEINRKFGRE